MRKSKVELKKGLCIIDGTGSNVFMWLVDKDGKMVIQYSAGNVGMKGPKKWTAYAASMTAMKLGEEALFMNYKVVHVCIRGIITKFVKEALRGLVKSGIIVKEIKLIMVHSHNGLRKRKVKRR